MSSTTTVISNTRSGCVHRWTKTLIPTARDVPSDAITASHQLLLRAGVVRQVGAGIYDYLPLGFRSLRKIEQIVREEMDAGGGCEMLMPALIPTELYKGTKRDVEYGDMLFTVTDRHGRVAALGPTHEEVITELAKASITSYKQFPLNLYQIQTKFRDEFRPRSGLLRGREFIMKDAYSFHLDIEGDAGLNATYDAMFAAYTNVFTRSGLNFTVVEAEAGPIGGSASHEFMVNADSGEDTIYVCDASGYAANVEKCEIGQRGSDLDGAPTGDLEEINTPNLPGIDGVAQFLGCEPKHMLKCIVLQPKEENATKWVVAVVRGDHDVNEGKVRDAVGFAVELGDEKAARAAGFAIGYVSPKAAKLIDGCLLVVDPDAAQPGEGVGWATGADKKDHHVKHFTWKREMGDASYVKLADIRNAVAGDPSPRAEGSTLREQRGIEVGHIFKLGTKYADAFKFTVLDRDQKKRSIIMGCYGIGVSRTMQACIEQSHDDNGIIWPAPIAPYHVHIVLMKPEDEATKAACERLCAGLSAAGCDVLVDDRKERPGVKFKDADLIGMPVRITIGPRGLEEDSVELKARTDESKGGLVKLDDVVATCVGMLNG